MLYICYRSWVRSSFARAILVMAHQNPYFSSRLIKTSFTVGRMVLYARVALAVSDLQLLLFNNGFKYIELVRLIG